jgi:hypothetical protein
VPNAFGDLDIINFSPFNAEGSALALANFSVCKSRARAQRGLDAADRYPISSRMV